MERDIVVFGYDDDPDDVEFQYMTIPAKYDIDYALKGISIYDNSCQV